MHCGQDWPMPVCARSRTAGARGVAVRGTLRGMDACGEPVMGGGA